LTKPQTTHIEVLMNCFRLIVILLKGF